MTVNRAPEVLIVDDEQPICELLCEVLGEQGYLCQAVNSGDEALALLKEKEFDIALLDIKMPGMSGIDLLGTISASYRNTSVLMTTAVNDMNTVVEAMQRGARDYVLKPFAVDEVRARVAKVLRDKALRGDGMSTRHGKGSSAQAQMDAMARGIEVYVSQFDMHAKIVIERTAAAARQMGIAEAEIDEWVAARRDAGLAKARKMVWATGEFGSEPEGRGGIAPEGPLSAA